MLNLLQISDLHIGDKFDNAKGAMISGFTAHDIALCRALDQFLDEDIRDIQGVTEEEVIPVIVNGDLTAGGREAEFEVANTFLFSRHALVKGNRVHRIGLDIEPKDMFAVPGNHDHWEGLRTWPNQRGFSRAIYDRFIDPPPYVSPPIVKDGMELRVFAIDSGTMFEETRLNRNPLANGGFSHRHRFMFRQIVRNTWRTPLAEGCDHRVGVIVCHHPFTRDGAAGPLRNQCVTWLCNLAAEFGIRMVFTGHTHYSWTSLLNVQTESGQSQVREVRCPTTLQHPARLDVQRRKPGVWLHQISAADGMVVWRGKLILYSGGAFRIPTEEHGISEEERVGWFEERIPSADQRS